MPQPASRRGQRARQHGPEMRVPVIVEPIEQVLDVQAGLGVALDREPALEEQRVRILGAGGQPDEFGELSADAHARLVGRYRHEPVSLDAEGQARARVLDTDFDRASVEFAEPVGQRLAAQQVIEGARQKPGVHGHGHESERNGQQGFEGAHRGQGLSAMTVPDPLIWIKPLAPRLP